MERIYRVILHRPKLILFFLALVTVFFAYHARFIRIDSSIESLLPQDDPEKQYYNDVRRLFGSEDVAVVGLITDNIYTPQTLQKIKRLTEEFKKIPEVKSVFSLSNAPDIVAKILGEPQDLLIPELPTTMEAAAPLKDRVAAQPIYLKNLASADGRAAAINIVFLESITDNEFVRRGVDEKIQAVIDAENGGPEQLYYTGLPHFKAASAKAMAEDLSRLLPLALLLIVIVLALCVRSVRGVVLPVLAVLISLIWTLGIMVLCGSRLSLGTLALPPLILVLGIAYSLHVITEYFELARPGRTVKEVLIETGRSINAPVFMAAVTTVLGFLSLFTNNIVSIRDMGIYSAIGITIAFVLAVVFVPAALALLELPSRRSETDSPALTAALRTLTAHVIRHRYAIIGVSVVIGLLSLWPIPSIQVGSNFLSIFRENHPVRQASEMINRNLVGSMAFYVVIDGKENDIMRQWDTLKRLKELQEYINSLPGVDKTVSLVDYCDLFDQGMRSLPPEEGTEAVPPEQLKSFWEDPTRLTDVMQMIFLNPSYVGAVVNHPNYSRSNILVRTSLTRPSEVAAVVEKIHAFAKEHFPPADLVVHPTGSLILSSRTASNLISGQVQSLALTAAVIFVVMTLMFLSVRVGVIAMIPNIFPILMFFALMGVSGAVLSLSTNTIASIVLGLAVDDTIHIMSRLSAEVRTTADQKEALLRALSTVGKPTLYYSLLVFLGFLTFGLSSFVPVQEFGLLSAVTILFGVVAELALLPALLATTPVITLWNVLYLKLGRDPHKTIPLFAGLRPFQAKIVTLMGELRSFPKDEAIIRRGEQGNEMYVLISGTADVFIPAPNGNRRVNTLERGDVFGEMGLLRHHERTADVMATEEVEVLAVNERFLDRIKRRYPRIATEIFFNLSKILSDRLEQSQRGGK
ncbi:MAG: MMPL family transporter [Deltaproteobacteria bacterium]|nr:MMPL family transporter [Deltaproteobacteria bacterium]